MTNIKKEIGRNTSYKKSRKRYITWKVLVLRVYCLLEGKINLELLMEIFYPLLTSVKQKLVSVKSILLNYI